MKTAVITGGTKGIGLGVVRMLVGRGYHVVASYAHDEAAADRVRQTFGTQVELVCADHSKREETYAFIDYIRRHVTSVDCIVCNAGMTVRKAFVDTTDEDWDAQMEVALNAHVILLRELFPLISRGGRILFTGSAMGIHPHATVLAYGVAKASVHALVKNLVKVFEEKEVTVNAVAPGFVETDWQKEKPEAIRQNICQKTAVHRFASIDETVDAFAFCLDNGFVNGSVIEVDGGYSYR